MIHQKPQKMFLYGASCSPVTDQIAKAARHWNLVQVSKMEFICGVKTCSIPAIYKLKKILSGKGQ